MKKIKFLLLFVISLIILNITSYAEAYWNEDWVKPFVKAEWDNNIDQYHFELWYGRGFNRYASNKILNQTINKNKCMLDVTENIYAHGTGIYVYKIVDRQNNILMESRELYVNSSLYNKICNKYDRKERPPQPYRPSIGPSVIVQPTPQFNGNINGWLFDGTSWRYAQNGNWITNNWVLVNGFWYYFDGNANMLKGWQYINNHYYYLCETNWNGYPEGACVLNGITPDNHRVNGNGELMP